MPDLVYTTLALDGLSVTLTVTRDAAGGVRAALTSPNAFLTAADGQGPLTFEVRPQRTGGTPIPYCSTCGAARPSDIPEDAPCPLCLKHGMVR